MRYAIEIDVNMKLTETQKNLLMMALGNAVQEVLGPAEFGSTTIYSEK